MQRGGAGIPSLIVGASLGLFLFGIILTMVGPALPYLITDFDLTLTEAGTLYSLRGLGSILAVLLGGLVTDLVGYRVVILTGAVCWVVGLFLFAVTQTVGVALGIWLLIGLGLGAVDTGINALVAASSRNKGAAMNRLHVWFGAGALVGPVLAGVLLTYTTWRVLVLFTAVLAGIFFAYMSRQSFPSVEKQTNSPWANIKQVWRGPIVCLGLVMAVYAGVGTSFLGWVNVFLISTLAMTTWSSSIVLSTYSVGLSVGRLVSSMIAERTGYERLLVTSASLSLISASVALFSRIPLVSAVAFALTGLFFACLLPTSIAIGAKRYPHLTGTVTGVLITLGSVGRALIPGMVGAVADVVGVAVGLRMTLGFIVILIVSTVYLSRASNGQLAGVADGIVVGGEEQGRR